MLQIFIAGGLYAANMLLAGNGENTIRKMLTALQPEPDEKGQSHGWEPVTVQRTGPRPRVYGKIRTEGILLEAPRYLTSSTSNIQILYALLCISDGPIKEPIVPGSLRLLGEDADNYDSDYIDYRWRHGDLTQYAMANHSRIRYDTHPLLKVTNDKGPVVHRTYGRHFHSLEFDVTFPDGLHDGTGASPANHTVNITLEVKKATSSVWLELTTTNITDDTTAAVIRSFDTDGVIAMDPYAAYDVRLRKNTADKNSDDWGDVLFLDTVREVLHVPLKRPGKALVAVEARATDELSGAFRFSCISRGRFLRDITDSNAIKFSRNFGLALFDHFTQPLLTGRHSAWDDLTLLLHFEGADADVKTYDSAPYASEVTFYGTAQLDTGLAEFGSSSLILNGSSDYLTIPDCGRWLCQNAYDDWTVDLFVFHQDHAGTELYLDQFEDANNHWWIYHLHGSGLRFELITAGSAVIQTPYGGEISDSAWHHIALCKVGTEYGLYMDGTQVSFVSDSSLAAIIGDLVVGRTGSGGAYLHGNIDELRIINRNIFSAAPDSGKTDTITPPVAPFTDPGNTYVDSGHEGYQDSDMDVPAFVELAEWCAETRVNPDKFYVDAITQETKAIVTTRSASGLGPGDTIVFRNVSQNGMVELVDGTQATILTILDSTSFRTGLDTSAFSAYESLNKAIWQFEGSAGDDFTTDASAQGHDIDSSGFLAGAQISETESKWGDTSLYLDGAGDGLGLAADADWEVVASTSDSWTIDIWVKHDDHAGTEVYIGCGGGTAFWTFQHEHGGGIRFYNRNAGGLLLDTGAAGEITDTGWHHIAIVKVGTDVGTYLDGAQVGYDGMVGGDALTYSDVLTIGVLDSASEFAGYIDELRIAKSNPFEAAPVVGVTDSITVPDAPYASEDFDAVDLLLHLDGADEATVTSDSSPNGHAITLSGAELDVAQSKFGISSLLFNGTSDYATIPNHAAWDFFGDAATSRTLDFWVRHTDHLGTEYYACQLHDHFNHWTIRHEHGFGLFMECIVSGSSVFQLSSGDEITDNNWHHLAIIKVADEYGLYLDGSQIAYKQYSSTSNFTGRLMLGEIDDDSRVPALGDYFAGHMDEIRLTSNNLFGAAPDAGLTDTITEPLAEYADPALTGTVEEYLPRVTYDDILTGEGTVWERARKMCKLARVTPYFKGSKISVLIDKADTPSYAFTMGNIRGGTYRRRLMPSAERASRITAHFRDASDDYERRSIRVDNPTLQGLTPYSKKRIDAFGFTHRKTVTDLVKFRLAEAEHINWVIQFGASADAIGVQVGHVVSFQHDTANWGRIGELDQHYTGGGRITSAQNGSVATVRIAGPIVFLDADFEGGSTRYNLMVMVAGDVQDIVPITGYDPATREIAVTGPFTDLPQPGNIWAAGVENLQTTDFRVVGKAEDEMSRSTFDLLEYSPECYLND